MSGPVTPGAGGSGGTTYTGTAPIVVAGSAISINAATGALPGSLSAVDKTLINTATTSATNSALCVRDGAAGLAVAILTAAAILFGAAATPTISQAQSTTGVGATTTFYAQQGLAGSVGGILRMGGGAGGTPGTQLAGATQIDLGATVGNIGQKFSLLSNAASILDMNQSNAGTVTLQGALSTLSIVTGGTLTLKSTSTVMLTINGVGVGLYSASPVAQAARAGQITDNTGGVASTTFAAIAAGAAYSQADMVAVKNALASISAQYNKLDTTIHNVGLSA